MVFLVELRPGTPIEIEAESTPEFPGIFIAFVDCVDSTLLAVFFSYGINYYYLLFFLSSLDHILVGQARPRVGALLGLHNLLKF